MRNHCYIIICLLVLIIVGMLSHSFFPNLFRFNEPEYIEIVELDSENHIEHDRSRDHYVEKIDPKIKVSVDKAGKRTLGYYYRNIGRTNFLKKTKNLYEETYGFVSDEPVEFKYSIHVFASKNEIRLKHLKLKGLYENFDKDESLYRYFYRSFDNYEDCIKALRYVRSSGFIDAYIVRL